MDRKNDWISTLLTVSLLVLIAFQLLTLRAPAQPVDYSDFRRLVAARQVDDLEITPTQITGSVRMPGAGALLAASAAKALQAQGAPWRFTTTRVTDDRLTDALAQSGIRYRGASDSTWMGTVLSWIVPVMAFFFVWSLLMRRGGGGADLANVVNEAALHAAELEKPAVDMSDFDEAIDRAMAGMERKSRVMNAQEKVIIAHHEAGHALVAQSRIHCDPVKKVSIIPRGVAALGYTQQVPTEDRYVLRKSELLDRLDVLLGGRVAEEIVFGDVSTGAENDLDRATAMARHMVERYGMSERLGLTTLGSTTYPVPGDGTHYSESTARLVDEEVRRLLREAHERVERTLRERREPLERIARRLLECEVLDRETLVRLIDGELPTECPAPVTASLTAPH
jgi:ATP-dependent Zn protease